MRAGLSYIDAPFSMPVPQARLWSPASPYLYNLDVYLFAEDVTVSKTSPSFGMQGILAAPDFDMGTVSDMVGASPLLCFPSRSTKCIVPHMHVPLASGVLHGQPFMQCMMPVAHIAILQSYASEQSFLQGQLAR